MSGIFPFAAESLTQLRIQKKDGKGINLIPWIYSATNPLVTFSLVENMFTPLMTGTIIVKDVGDWSGEMDLNAFDEVVVKLASKRVSGDLGTGTEDEERFKTYNLKFEITNIKNTVNLANSAYQNGLETAKALTIEFVSKSVLTKEFLSSLLEEDNFIGPIINSNVENFELSGTQANTVSLKGFNNYLKEKLDITLDGDRTWNYCYLKKNNVSYPWGKLKGQPTILQTLQYLSENAVSYENNKVVNYLFWQDLSGYHFRSIDSLIQQNEESAKDFTYMFTDLDLQTNSIRSFETLTEFDTLNLLSEKAYFTWYERIIPDYADPYIDFVDSSDALKRKNISFDASQEYSQINHIENGKLFPDGLTQDIDPKYKKLTESRRTDDDIYGFYSKNRYNTPHPQEWDYLGISADTRLSNVVWQNQYDIGDEVYPEILYAYDKLIKKELEKNRELYVNLKNAKRKWEVYRCSVCCLDQLGGTADQQIIKSLSSDSPDYVYYFGPTGIFGDIQSDGYGIVAAGAFSDVVNYLPGVSGVSGNGLTLSYDMNSYPYNQTIGEFYHLKQDVDNTNQQIDNLILEYQTELNKINPYITKIENDFLPFVDSWITEATNFIFDNLTPGFNAIRKFCVNF